MKIVASFFRSIASGLGIGIGLMIVVGIVVYVQAVAPGAVKNPTFGPQDDDVDLGSTPVFFSQSSRVRVFSTTSCSYASVWTDVNLTARVPASARQAIVITRCAENSMFLRSSGSTLGQVPETTACSAGDNESDYVMFIVDLSGGHFETSNVGADCPTRHGYIDLVGFVQ